jgi:hypothetical protein
MGQDTITHASGQTRMGHSTQFPQPAPISAIGSFMARSATAQELAAWHWQVQPRDEGEMLSWLIMRWNTDPVMFAIEALRIVLLHYQAQALLDLADAPREVYEFYGLDPTLPKRQVLLPSGHGLGKTRLSAVATWWHLLCRRFSKTICTAPTSDQLTGSLWGELRKMYRRLKKRWPALADEWDILGGSIQHKNPEYGDWHVIARTSRADKPEGVQGAHAMDADDELGDLAALFGEEHDNAPSGGILIICEEASGIDDGIRETLEGSLSEEGARLLAPGNPTRADGWFARDMERRERYAVHHLDCRMSDRTKVYSLPYRDFGGTVHHIRSRGFVHPRYWEGIIGECDDNEDADRVRVRVRGMKPRSSSEQIIRTHWVDAAEHRQPDDASRAEPAIIGLDFGLTSDKHALAVRRGYTMVDGDEWLPKDEPEQITLDAADRAIEAQQLHNARYIIGDSNGVGRGAMEYLSRHYSERPELNVTVILFNSGEGAIDKARYYRRRDEMWFAKGRAWFADPRCSIPSFPGLKTQLTVTQYHEDTMRRIRAESKQDIKARTGQASGNLADALLQTLMVHTHAAPAPKPEKDPWPKALDAHFKRFTASQEAGYYIR